MKFIRRSDTILVDRIITSITDEKGVELGLGIDYTFDAPAITVFNAVVKDPFTITTLAPVSSNIKVNSTITIIDSNGIEITYTVQALGANALKFRERLADSINTPIQFKEKEYLLTFSASVADGLYFDNYLEAYFVSDRFSSVFIDKASILQMYPQLSGKENIQLLNDNAREEVRADFSFDTNFHNVIDLGQLKVLVKLKSLEIWRKN